MPVESFGNLDNLMVDACQDLQGHAIVVAEAGTANVFRDPTGFEACLKMAHVHDPRPEERFHPRQSARTHAR